MFHEYIYLENLTPFQKEKVQNFNKDHNIQYEKISNCEICGSEKINILFNNDRYGINQKTSVCDNCGFMFSNPRMTDTSAQYFYNSDLYRLLYDGTGKSFAGTQLFGSNTQRWDVIAHELGHAWLGFEDLYLFKGGAPLGQWDMMSSSGAEFSGWSRFLAGWIEPNWVRCATPRTPTRHYLSALNADKSDDKPRMLVLPLNSQSAIIAELRPPTVWQTNLKSPTLIVYRVDTGIAHGNGPIVLIGTTDQNGGTLTSDGVKITVKGINTSGVIVDISN